MHSKEGLVGGKPGEQHSLFDRTEVLSVSGSERYSV